MTNATTGDVGEVGGLNRVWTVFGTTSEVTVE